MSFRSQKLRRHHLGNSFFIVTEISKHPSWLYPFSSKYSSDHSRIHQSRKFFRKICQIYGCSSPISTYGHFSNHPLFFHITQLCPRLYHRIFSTDTVSGHRNLHLFSIGYAFRPRLRSRLTRGRSALPRNPWIFGLEDSHLHLATHSGILSSRRSTAPYGTASVRRQCSPTNVHNCTFPGFGGVFQPRTFSAQDLSASELLRTL